MGSPLGPTLANIIMTAFEDEIVRKLFDSDVIKFYARYVDDTLIVAKPSDFNNILETFNTFHLQIQFTLEEFPDNNVHFLDLQINSSDITIFRKPTHTGQTLISQVSPRGHVKQHGLEPWSIVPLKSVTIISYSSRNSIYVLEWFLPQPDQETY